MLESVDEADSKSVAARRVGSSPTTGTIFPNPQTLDLTGVCGFSPSETRKSPIHLTVSDASFAGLQFWVCLEVHAQLAAGSSRERIALAEATLEL